MSNTQSIRISGITPESIVNGEGIRYVVFTQGCPHHCPGCHNPSTHSFDGGKLISLLDIIKDIRENAEYIDGITLSGGEPFCQPYQCSIIAREAQKLGLSVWCYTGYFFEDLYEKKDALALLKFVDVLVDGPFIIEERSLDLDFRGSRNQRLIDVHKSSEKAVTTLDHI